MRSVQKSQIPFFKTKTTFLKIFFPAVRLEWNKVMLIFVTRLLVMFLRELY